MQGTYWTVYNQQTIKGQGGSSQSLGRREPILLDVPQIFLFQTLVLRTEIISVVLSHPVHSYLLWQPQKVIILKGDLFMLEIWNNNHWQFYATFEEHCKFFCFIPLCNETMHCSTLPYSYTKDRVEWGIVNFRGRAMALQVKSISCNPEISLWGKWAVGNSLEGILGPRGWGHLLSPSNVQLVLKTGYCLDTFHFHGSQAPSTPHLYSVCC